MAHTGLTLTQVNVQVYVTRYYILHFFFHLLLHYYFPLEAVCYAMQ